MYIGSYIGMIHLERLKQKKMAKPKQNVNIQLRRGVLYANPIAEKKKDEDDEDDEDREDEVVEDENGPLIEPIVDEAQVPQIRTNIRFVDKTNDYRVNRDLVLANLGKYMNMGVVEKKKMGTTEPRAFKIPIIERDPYTANAPPIVAKKIKTKVVIDDKDEVEKEKEVQEDEVEEEKDLEEERDLEEEKDLEDEEVREKEVEQQDEQDDEEETDVDEPSKKKGPSKKGTKEKAEKEKGDKDKTKEKAAPKKKTRKVYEETDYDPAAKIGRKLVSTRMPKKEKFVVRTSDYYMNNRKLYIQKIADLFRPYKKEILESMESASCDQTNNPLVDFELLTHQKIVRDYLNIYTPYRGLLLYHGLGSGKTCTSIAIAEGMKSSKPIILMTPASLQKNFFNEIKKCGDLLYKKNQYWEFVSIKGKPNYVSVLSNALQLPVDYIEKKKGAWMVDVSNKEANFTTLTSSQQMEINDQLDLMIRAKYTTINYNGIRMSNLKEWSKDFTVNPFDNATIIIEEAHNFVSRIVNKINKPNTLSYKLYDYLMKASNAKVVLLTGTPIINYPNELGILFNILRGYIKKWTFQVNVKSTAPPNFKVNKDEIIKMFDNEGLATYDYVEYSGNKLSITRNPYGFVNVNKKAPKKRGGDSGLVGKMMKFIGGKFIGGITHKAKAKTTSKKRTRKANKGQDKVVEDQPTDVEDIDTIDDMYPDGRSEYNYNAAIDPHEGGDASANRDAALANRDSMVGGGDDEYGGVVLDETGNISDEDFEKKVRRILTANHMEIVPAGSSIDLLKALPDNSESFLNMFVDNDTIQVKNENVFKKRILGLSSYFRSAQEKLLPRFVKTADNDDIHIVRVDMSQYQFNVYEHVRKKEADDEKSRRTSKKKANPADDLFTISSTYRIFSRAACNFAFPDPPGRPMPDRNKGAAEDSNDYGEALLDAISNKEAAENDEYASPEDDLDKETSENKPLDYEQRIKTALQMLEDSITKSPEEQYLSAEKLAIYSPKFLKIIENITNDANRGLHLLYSQFRTIEGIGILRLVLKANGFAELRIKKTDSTGMWELDESEEDVGKPKFALHTGTETPEEKEIIRNIYNSQWEIVPTNISARLREIADNNHYGEVLKVLMITASSAEGINLKNTRFVHLVEPYWHRVRIEQAIGRARRICSHQDLPEEDRTVQAFLYITVFSEDQKKNKKNIEMMGRDTSRIDGRPVTTDESLLDTSTIKHNINKVLLNSVKETAIDCSVYNSTTNADEGLVCYGFGKVESNSFASYPEIEKDMGETIDVNIRKEKLQLKMTKPINGVVYVYNPKTLEVFDKDSYDQALEGRGELMKIGVFVKSGRGFVLKL